MYKLVERKSEPHPECIFFATVLNQNGVPVPGVQSRIWAGDPPYYEMDNPPRTDAAGKVMFIAMDRAMPENRDYYVQFLDPNRQPISERGHMPWRQGESSWWLLTFQEEAAPGEVPPRPTPEVTWDKRLDDLRVSLKPVQVQPGQRYWRLTSAIFQDHDESGGNHTIYYTVLDENGRPIANQRVVQGWPDGTADARTNQHGQTDIALWAGYNPALGPGPYSAWVADLPSDRVEGMGLPQKQHVNFVLTFQRTVAVEPTPSPTHTPAPGKALYHYLLFGSPTVVGTRTNLFIAQDYIMKFRPVVGFSVEEALNAQHVTIVGDERAVSAADEQRLRQAGCQVQRLSGDSYTLEQLFASMVQQA